MTRATETQTQNVFTESRELKENLSDSFRQVRQLTEQICQPLAIEDHGVQSSPDVSPPKWHLAHTTWFFEKFLLDRVDPAYDVLFNSYYETVGHFAAKDRRGAFSRPLVDEVYAYRARVDEAVMRLLENPFVPSVKDWVRLGLHHEQQHQELLRMDIQYNAFTNIIPPPYPMGEVPLSPPIHTGEWLEREAGLYEIGHDLNPSRAFSFDNEHPRHQQYLERVAIRSSLVTQGEYLDFIESDGYQNPALWLSEGWKIARERQWEAPLYWRKKDSSWQRWSAAQGWREINPELPVSYLNYYEASAFARWKGMRLPTEAEWEVAAKHHSSLANPHGDFFGVLWQWTQSAYLPYPKARAYTGHLAEYNSKFMCNQMVLRGSSYLTPEGHSRVSYRNFYAPEARWQPAGLRLARDL
jgi:ergothioneine biosynthesis protein EgtB